MKKYALMAGSGLVSAAILFLPLCSAAAAETKAPAASELTEVIVTANRREESLQKVPLSVTAVSGAALEAKSIRSLSDLQVGQVPGVVFAAFSTHKDSMQMAIRGIATNDSTQGSREIPVPLYIDGVYLGRSQGTGLELIEPERIEVLRGPQGTLFGRNAEGGAVQIVSRKPTGVFGGKITGTVGNFDYKRIRATVDLPDVNGFKLQLSGLYSDRGAVTKNGPASALSTGSVLGIAREVKDYGISRTRGGRAALRYDGIENLTVDLTVDATKGSSTGLYATNSGPAFVGGRAPSNTFVTVATRPAYNGFLVVKASGEALTMAYNVSNAITLKSISSYRQVTALGYNDGAVYDIGPAFGLPDTPAGYLYPESDNNLRQRQYSEEAQILGAWDHLTLTAGGVYYHEVVTQYYRTAFYAGPGLLLFGLPNDFSPGPRTGQRGVTNSLGLYAQGTYTPPILDDKLELTAGVRYSHDRKTATRFLGALTASPFDPREQALDLVARIAANRWDPAFVIKYNFTPLVNVYGRYSQAYRAGGVNSRSALFKPYNSEVTKAFELGLKAETEDRRLTFDVALYQNKIHNPQFDLLESPLSPAITTTVNVPVIQRMRGVEIETVYRPPIEGLTVSATYAYTQARLPNFLSPTNLPAGLVTLQPIFTPKHAGSVDVDYKTPAPMGTLALHADFAASSGYLDSGDLRLANAVPAPLMAEPLITRQLNGRIGLEDLKVGGSKATVSLWAKNILNRHDYAYTLHLPSDNIHLYHYFIEPRTYGLDLSLQF